jgi:hypothetical protein
MAAHGAICQARLFPRRAGTGIIHRVNRPGGVTAAAVVSLLWSLVTLLVGVGFSFAAFAQPTAPAPIGSFKVYMLSLAAFTVGLSALGIATSIGLFRLRPWARISILIFSGIVAPICLLTTALMFFMPLPATPGFPGGEPALRAIVAGIYGLPLLITTWWLIQFSTARTKAAFAGDSVGPSRPLIVMIVGWGNLIGGVACIIPVLMGLPAFALGFILRDTVARLFYFVFGALSAWLGWELLKMKERARVLTLAWFGLIALNSMYATLSPTARARMIELQTEISRQPAAPELDMNAFLIASMTATLLLLALGAWLLVRAKPAFESSAESSAAPAAPAPPA